MDIFNLFANLEDNTELHLSRLLILLGVFAGKEGEENIEGLTKLAKLDFLLRYPVYLERALEERGQNPSKVNVEDFERYSVESSMTRFRYGPWDFRYRKFLNLMVGKGLVTVGIKGRTIMIGLTENGRSIFSHLASQEEFQSLYQRAKLLKIHLDFTATNLMKYIYKTFPEIGNLKLGEEIE